jgi:hypothetical protein
MMSLILCVTTYANSEHRLKLGLGYGNGFGMLGGSAEFEVYHTAILGGVGTAFIDELSWDFGLRYYLFKPRRKVRPHITASYGHTHLIKRHPNQAKNLKINYGYIFLLGLDHDVGEPDFFVTTYGVGFGIPNEIPQQVKDIYQLMNETLPEPNITIALAVGIKYQF